MWQPVGGGSIHMLVLGQAVVCHKHTLWGITALPRPWYWGLLANMGVAALFEHSHVGCCHHTYMQRPGQQLGPLDFSMRPLTVVVYFTKVRPPACVLEFALPWTWAVTSHTHVPIACIALSLATSTGVSVHRGVGSLQSSCLEVH